jgi:hypothetical protein
VFNSEVSRFYTHYYCTIRKSHIHFGLSHLRLTCTQEQIQGHKINKNIDTIKHSKDKCNQHKFHLYIWPFQGCEESVSEISITKMLIREKIMQISSFELIISACLKNVFQDYFNNTWVLQLGAVVHIWNLGTWWVESGGLDCELEVSLGYIASSRPTWATQGDLSQQNAKQTNKKIFPPLLSHKLLYIQTMESFLTIKRNGQLLCTKS